LKTIFFAILLFFNLYSNAQSTIDTITYQSTVTVTAFGQNANFLKSVVNSKNINVDANNVSNKSSMLSAVNTIAGVKMEERSPGSYRLNIRNSALRSPFGVRNVKMYWNDIPMTDANGNTYFNQLATNSFSTIEIVKGPTSSMYGAGTGGLLLLQNQVNSNFVKAEFNTGSYNTNNLFLTATTQSKAVSNYLSIAVNASNGYRQQSKMNRKNLTYFLSLQNNAKHKMYLGLLYTDLNYQTPGGLTLNEYERQPTLARPATGIFPSAITAKAAIAQQTIIVGIGNVYQISKTVTNTSTLFINNATIKNAAIRNYEIRQEPNIGLRSVFTLHQHWSNINIKLNAGIEMQQAKNNNKVFSNQLGNPDTLQVNSNINNKYGFCFVNSTIEFKKSWFLNLGTSINTSSINIESANKNYTARYQQRYTNEQMPRFAIRKLFNKNWSALATIAKGFSPPTVAELLPSTTIINTALKAEKGWSYENTIQYYYKKGKHLIMPEITFFHFNVNNAIAQKRDISGADYFENAGKIKQQGVEVQLQYTYFKKAKHKLAVNQIKINIAYTYSNFFYKDYVKLGVNFSGKKLPSVPKQNINCNVSVQLQNGLCIQANVVYASKMFLNDANTVTAEAYTILTSKINYPLIHKAAYKIEMYLNADNILNQNYSLGFDINAVNNRFYNPAAKINFAAGVALMF
jgi:iron complex outermembrane recepter protein